MRFKTTWIVLVLAIALAGFVWLQGRRDAGDAEKRAAAARLLTGLEREAITAVRIATGTNHIDLQKRSGEWFMLAPVPAPCDPRAIAAFLDTLVAAQREDDIGKEDLARYGLDAPASSVEVDAAGKTRRLSVGRINPQQTLVYVLVDGSRDVLLTTSNLLTQAVQSPFGWREKRMLDVDPDALTRISMRTHQSGSLALRRDPTHGWQVEGALPWRADPVRARSLAFGLARLEAVGVAAENKADLTSRGLDNARFSAVLETASGPAGELTIGFAVGDGSYFGMVPKAPEVWRFDGKLADLIVEMVRAPHDRAAFPPYEADRVTRIEGRTGDDVFTLERRSAMDWVVTKSSRVDSTFALATGAVTGLLTELATVRVQEFPTRQPPAAQFDKPSLVLRLFEGERAASGIEVGKRDASGVFLWARGPGEPAAFLLSPADLLRMPFDLERLKSDEVQAPTDTDRG